MVFPEEIYGVLYHSEQGKQGKGKRGKWKGIQEVVGAEKGKRLGKIVSQLDAEHGLAFAERINDNRFVLLVLGCGSRARR